MTRALVLLVALAGVGRAQEGAFLSEDQAPAAVFSGATRFERLHYEPTDALKAQVAADMGDMPPSAWETQWVVFRAFRGDELAGHALLVEEVGKHRSIDFVVGLRPDGTVEDVAVMAYREAYGGEIASRRFLGQYRGKGPGDGVKPYRDVRNVAGATLSVEAASRAVRKAQALAAALELARP
jgi:hypothetical protein